MTVLDLVTRALMDLGLVQAGEALAGDDADLALVTLNDWIDGLKVERLTLPWSTRTTWTITANVQDYTVGTGSTVNVARPSVSDGITIHFQDTSVSPVFERNLILLTEDAWAAIALKTLTSPYPIYAFYNPNAATTGTISLYYVPTSTTLQGVLYAPTAVSEFAALTDTVALAPGYRRFARTNLAVELAAAFNVPQPPPTLMQAAMESKAAIKTANVRMSDLTLDRAVLPRAGRGYSIVSDGY